MADNGEGSVGIEMIPVRGTEVSANAGEPPAAYQAPSGETGRGLDIEAGHSLDKGLPDHKDSHNRYASVKGEERYLDHYLRPEDGKLSLLRVQHIERYLRPPNTRTSWVPPQELSRKKRLWRAFQNGSTHILAWTYEEWLNEMIARTNPDGSQNYRHKSWKTLYWKYPLASIGLTAIILFSSFGANVQHNGQYPMVRYRYYGYPMVTRNKFEGRDHAVIDQRDNAETSTRNIENSNPAQSQTNEESSKKGNPLVTKLRLDQPIRQKANSRPDESDGALGRHLRPRYLCLVPGDDDEEAMERRTYQIVDVDEWDERNKGSDRLQYVFVSYTRDQFQTYIANDIQKWRLPTDQQARQQEEARRRRLVEMHPNDLQQLYEIGIKAAEDAKVKAFWIDVLCMEPKTVEVDAHRICDVARGAKSLVIALKDKVDDRIKSRASSSVDTLLENWASRLWTLPEMLLAPTKHDLVVWRYTRNGPRKLDTIAKRNMAERAYTLDEDDPHLVRQLVDHFESNLHLSQTELLTIGLECLVKRDTRPYTPGDPVYALMTLARRRPEPKREDSLFVAFAKLSLMNESDELLERLICMLPPARGKPWYKIQDYWKAKLSDIDPICQVAGIAADQSVILDGAEGASIVWHEIPRVAFMKRHTLWRVATEMTIRLSPIWLIISITTLAPYAQPVSTPVYTNNDLSFHSSVNSFVAVGIVFLLLAISLVSMLPWALLSMYRGKFWSTQAWFIGIEGPVNDLRELERKMFGFSEGRLKWSAYNSTLSRHRPRINHQRLQEGECEGIPPSTANLPLENNVVVRQYDWAGNLPQPGMPKTSQSSAWSSNSEGSWSEGTQDARADRTESKTEVEPDRIFTLVDTYTMTATTFRAVHPPSVVLVCGREGGAQRALLCSYNYRTQTFHRETVLRMQTEVRDRMARIPRFRFSMESQPLIPSVVAR